MDEYHERLQLLEREPAFASTHGKARWFAAWNAFDPAHDQVAAAQWRSVGGTEAAPGERRH